MITAAILTLILLTAAVPLGVMFAPELVHRANDFLLEKSYSKSVLALPPIYWNQSHHTPEVAPSSKCWCCPDLREEDNEIHRRES